MDIFLLRHGALGEAARGRYIGQIDLPLDATGLEQARRQARWLAGPGLDTIFSSDLTRCRQTAELIAASTTARIRFLPALRELALGEWEGQDRAHIAATQPARYAARGHDLFHERPPGGESFADCLQRLLPAWQQILAAPGRRVAIVAHAGVNRLLISHALGRPPARLMDIAQAYGCLNWLRGGPEGWQAPALNLVPQDEALPCLWRPVPK